MSQSMFRQRHWIAKTIAVAPALLLWLPILQGYAAKSVAQDIATEASSVEKTSSENSDSDSNIDREMLVIVGAGGGEKFKAVFDDATSHLETIALENSVPFHQIGNASGSGQTDLDRIKSRLEELDKQGSTELWIVLIGHGTFDGSSARFNLRGPDLSSTQLAEWLSPFERPLIIVNCSSASAPFLNAISAPNRIIITSTRSGFEQNFSYFATYFVAALGNQVADIDKDDQTSLLESYLYATSRVAEFYEADERLVTEHPLLDDNGDQRGTPPDWFEGVRVVKRDASATSPDGLRAHQIHLVPSEFESQLSAEQRTERNRLELALEELRARKPNLAAEEYMSELDMIVSQLSSLYASIEHEQNEIADDYSEIEVQQPLQNESAPRPNSNPTQ